MLSEGTKLAFWYAPLCDEKKKPKWCRYDVIFNKNVGLLKSRGDRVWTGAVCCGRRLYMAVYEWVVLLSVYWRQSKQIHHCSTKRGEGILDGQYQWTQGRCRVQAIDMCVCVCVCVQSALVDDNCHDSRIAQLAAVVCCIAYTRSAQWYGSVVVERGEAGVERHTAGLRVWWSVMPDWPRPTRNSFTGQC